MWSAVSFTRLNLSGRHSVLVSVLLFPEGTLQQPVQYCLFTCFLSLKLKFQLEKHLWKMNTIRFRMAKQKVLKIYQKWLNNNNNSNNNVIFSCLRHFLSGTSLEPKVIPPLRLQVSDCSTFRITCDFTNIADFCSESYPWHGSQIFRLLLLLLLL